MDYTYENKEVELNLPEDAKNITKEFLIEQTKSLNVKYDGHRVRNEKLRVYFKDNAVLDADLKTGKGSLEFKRKVPIIGHSMYLHKSTNSFGFGILIFLV